MIICICMSCCFAFDTIVPLIHSVPLCFPPSVGQIMLHSRIDAMAPSFSFRCHVRGIGTAAFQIDTTQDMGSSIAPICAHLEKLIAIYIRSYAAHALFSPHPGSSLTSAVLQYIKLRHATLTFRKISTRTGNYLCLHLYRTSCRRRPMQGPRCQ